MNNWGVKSLSHVQLYNPMDCSPPGPSVHGILQARILEWVVIPFSRGSSQPKDQSRISCIAGRYLTGEPTGRPMYNYICVSLLISNAVPIFACVRSSVLLDLISYLYMDDFLLLLHVGLSRSFPICDLVSSWGVASLPPPKTPHPKEVLLAFVVKLFWWYWILLLIC